MGVKKRFDETLLILTFLLLSMGLLAFESTASFAAGSSPKSLLKQLIIVSLGLLFLLIMLAFDARNFKRLSFVISLFLISCVLLVMAYFNKGINGSHRWIRFMGFSFQPGEMAKLTGVIYAGWIIGRKDLDIRKIFDSLIKMLPLYPLLLLILFEPDYGTTFLIATVIFIMMFMAGLPKFKALFLLGLACTGGYFVIAGHENRVERTKVFFSNFISFIGSIFPKIYSAFPVLKDFSYHSDLGLQQARAEIAIASGKIWGVGIGKSSLKSVSSHMPLTYSDTDYIFAIVNEEMGAWGALILIVLYLLICYRGLLIAQNAERVGERQLSLIACGISVLITLQALVHMMVNLSLLPSKGFTLPLISAGGSSAFFTLLSIGVLLSISKIRPSENTRCL